MNNTEQQKAQKYSAYSYLIYKDGMNICAVNSTTGAIDYSGRNAADLINNVIATLKTGGMIFLRSGIYNISSKLILTPGINLMGEGPYGTIINNIGTDDAIYYNGSIKPNLDAEISNIQIKGNVNSLNGLNLILAQRLVISNCKFSNHGNSGILLQGSNIIRIDDCTCNYNSHHGIYMKKVPNFTSNANTVIGGDQGLNGFAGIRIEDDCVNNRLIGTTIQSNGTYGIEIIKNTASPVMNSIISCYAEANTLDNFRLDGCTRQLVTGCIAVDSGKGLSCVNTVARSLIMMNYFDTLYLDNTSTYISLIDNDVITLSNHAAFGYYQLLSNIQGLNSTPIAIPVKAGKPVDSDFPSPVNGLLVADTVNNKIWVRIGEGIWI